MYRPFLFSCFIAGVITASASAQQFFGSSRSFGSSSFGSSFGASSFGSGFGSGGFGSSSFGSSGFGGGFGSSGFGGGFGSSGLGSSRFGGGFGSTSGYGRGGRNRGFVSRAERELAGELGGFSAFRSGRRGRSSRQSASPQANQPLASTPPLLVRVRLNVAIDPPPASSSPGGSIAARRLQGLLVGQGVSSADVQVAGRIATLRGEVNSQRERRMAERIVALEPGISDVKNELVVKEPLPLTAPQ